MQTPRTKAFDGFFVDPRMCQEVGSDLQEKQKRFGVHFKSNPLEMGKNAV